MFLSHLGFCLQLSCHHAVHRLIKLYITLPFNIEEWKISLFRLPVFGAPWLATFSNSFAKIEEKNPISVGSLLISLQTEKRNTY